MADINYKDDAEKLLRYIILNGELFDIICSPGGKIELASVGLEKFEVKLTRGVYNEETGEVELTENSYELSTEKKMRV